MAQYGFNDPNPNRSNLSGFGNMMKQMPTPAQPSAPTMPKWGQPGVAPKMTSPGFRSPTLGGSAFMNPSGRGMKQPAQPKPTANQLMVSGGAPPENAETKQMRGAGYNMVHSTETSYDDLVKNGIPAATAQMLINRKGEIGKNGNRVLISRSWQKAPAKKTAMLAKGTKSFRGGKAIVGEKGPELVTLPKGTKVKPKNMPVLPKKTPVTKSNLKLTGALRRKFAK